MERRQFDYFLEQTQFQALIREYATDRRSTPMALIVAQADDWPAIVDRYGVDAARKLMKWAMLEVDLRVKREDVVGMLSPRHIACLCYDIDADDARRVAERLLAGIVQDQPRAGMAQMFTWPMKQRVFSCHLNEPEEEGYADIIDGSSRRLRWEHHKPQPASYWTSYKYDTRPPADLVRCIRLLDRRITLSVAVAQRVGGEPADDWIARATATSDLVSGSGGNRAGVI